jgi:hypothetical protein
LEEKALKIGVVKEESVGYNRGLVIVAFDYGTVRA